MKINIYKRIIVFAIGILLLLLSLSKNGEKFVKDTGNIICLECIGLEGNKRRLRKNK